MRTCLIAPIPDLDRFVGDRFTHHLLLSHLFDIPGWGESYLEFYSRRSRAGDFLTIDNGAKEHGHGETLSILLARAQQVRAREVVLPDVRFDSSASKAASVRELYYLKNYLHEAYESAGRPQLMIVPHGETPIDWHNCFFGTRFTAEEVLAELEAPAPTYGIAYAYDHRFEHGITPLIDHIIGKGVPQGDIHLLGWPRRLETLAEVARSFPDLRSVDSSRPIVYGQRMIRCGERPYPGRDKVFFTAPTPHACAHIIHQNIDMFRRYARGIDT